MSNKTLYEGTRNVRTFVDLNHSSNVLISKSKQEKRGSYHTTMAAILMAAFTFEAYLNHLGEMKIKFWDRIESVRIMDKYMILCKEFDVNPDFSKLPYQTLKLLFKFRNSIAHGRSKVLQETKKVDPDSDPYDHNPKTEWEEFCNLENAEKSKSDVEKIITELHIAAGLGDYPFINGMSIGSMRRK